jgi:hypothetical protein
MGRWCGTVSGEKLKMHVSRLRMGRALDGVGFRGKGVWGLDVRGERAYVGKNRNGWGRWGSCTYGGLWLGMVKV